MSRVEAGYSPEQIITLGGDRRGRKAIDMSEVEGYNTLNIGRSSNGRTADSGSAYRGSNPCLPAFDIYIKI